jgi:hypothetical protein
MKPIKNRKRIDPRYFLHETAMIEDELAPTAARDVSPALRNLIQIAALKWKAAPDGVEEIMDSPLGVWATLMDLVQAAWGVQHKNVHGCPAAPESKECGIINSVLASFQKNIAPLVEAINAGAADGGVRRFIAKNKRAIWGSMDYVPADKKDGKSYMKTKAWRRGQANPVLPEPGDPRVRPEDTDDL